MAEGFSNLHGRFWALSPPPIDGCPILRVLCEGWDSQISPFNLPPKADLFLRTPGPPTQSCAVAALFSIARSRGPVDLPPQQEYADFKRRTNGENRGSRKFGAFSYPFSLSPAGHQITFDRDCPFGRCLLPCRRGTSDRNALPRGAVDSEPERFAARPELRLEHQSLSRMRVRLPLLLCPLYPRVHGTAAGRFRAEDFHQAERGVAAGTGTEAGSPRRRDRPRAPPPTPISRSNATPG